MDISRRLAALLSVKSIVTIIMTLVFAYLSVSGRVDSESFRSIYLMIIAFYFGSQSQKVSEFLDTKNSTNTFD